MFLNLKGARVDETGENIILIADDESGHSFELKFRHENADVLIGALATAMGHAARQRTGDTSLKKVLPVDWWEIGPDPRQDGALFSYRIQGGLEMTFHIGATALPRYEEVLRTLTGSLISEIPVGPNN